MGFLGLQSMSKYDYYINCQKLMPPLDERFPYTAFVEYIYEVTEGGRKRIDIDFGETKGVTLKVAEKEMRKKVELWISEQKSHFEESHETYLRR
jgi:hypothetical protein